ncbi:ABC transporter permease [Clostridium fallax]|uniref:Monosaccharide ABC transporter membrane protein, CUT2 family n=1 Tax=Clostridium fallax TaxID=1533 RepID=A0A1M4XCU7_9CLOT|nr:ABC transporter permease [Clostridium fallax]SHE91399.1 monosaccharide ABC transporter membrane protein, CUT2 family [Clostridium fallax]SQB05971.1 ribose transport system permease protein rbsC [Clostridium fallax]
MEEIKVNNNTKKKSLLKNNKDIIQKLAAGLSLLVMCIFFSFATPYFLDFDNIITIALQTSVIGIMAIGVTFVIVTSGIDLSLGAIIALSGVSAGIFINNGINLVLSIILALLVGMIFGAINGFLIGKLKLPPFIATLGSMMLARGITLVLTDAKPVYFDIAPAFKNISQGKLFGTIPYPVIYLIVISVISAFILKKTLIGRYTYAIGSNEEAARLSGVNIFKTKMFVYMYCGLLCAVSGIIMAARINSGQPTAGQGYELDAIAAVVIGGTSLSGGEGSVVGTFLGAFIMGVLKNGLNLMNVSQNWQMVAMGIVVIGAVYLDKLRKAKK